MFVYNLRNNLIVIGTVLNLAKSSNSYVEIYLSVKNHQTDFSSCCYIYVVYLSLELHTLIPAYLYLS